MSIIGRAFFVANVLMASLNAVAFVVSSNPINGASAIFCAFAAFVLWKTSPSRRSA